jgi:hypothetical protein
MNKSFFRKIIIFSAAAILFISIIFGFAVTFKLQNDASTEKDFFYGSILDQGSALNRVVFAAAEYTKLYSIDNINEDWINEKILKCEELISHGSIPPFISEDQYLKYINDDPLLLSERLSEVENAYTVALASLEDAYKQIEQSETYEEKAELLLYFNKLFDDFMKILKERSYVMRMFEATYHSQLRFNIDKTQETVTLILIGQTIAVLASLILIIFNFISQSKDVKVLKGLIPICAKCKKIRDDKGYWNQVETYIHEHSEADFSHGICPECAKELYPDYFEETAD